MDLYSSFRVVRFVAILVLSQFLGWTDQTSTKLLCDYYFYSNQSECFIDHVDLTDLDTKTEFVFSGSTRVKNRTVLVGFLSSNLNFIPFSIVSQFPNFETLQIKRCQIPSIIDDKLFEKFSQITRLTVSYSNVKQIQENAFATLKNLEKIWLNDNQLEAIESNIFKNNFKLKFIHLGDNKITKLTPQLFNHLIYLEEFHFKNNKCADEIFENLGSNLLKLHRGLSDCFAGR